MKFRVLELFCLVVALFTSTAAHGLDWFFTSPVGELEYPRAPIPCMGVGPSSGSKTLAQYKRNETTQEFEDYGFIDPANPVVATSTGMWSVTGHGELTFDYYHVGRYRLLFIGDNQQYFDVVDEM